MAVFLSVCRTQKKRRIVTEVMLSLMEKEKSKCKPFVQQYMYITSVQHPMNTCILNAYGKTPQSHSQYSFILMKHTSIPSVLDLLRKSCNRTYIEILILNDWDFFVRSVIYSRYIKANRKSQFEGPYLALQYLIKLIQI